MVCVHFRHDCVNFKQIIDNIVIMLKCDRCLHLVFSNIVKTFGEIAEVNFLSML